MSRFAFLDRRRGLPRLGRNCVTPDPSPTRDALHLPRCATKQVVEVYDHDEDDRRSSPSTPRANWNRSQFSKSGPFLSTNDETVSTTGSGSQDDTSSVSSGMDDLEAENARLQKELEMMRTEARLIAENEVLKRENLLMKRQCEEFRRAALKINLLDAVTEQVQMPRKDSSVQNCAMGLALLNLQGVMTQNNMPSNFVSQARNNNPQISRSVVEHAKVQQKDNESSIDVRQLQQAPCGTDTRTTVMLRSFPNNYRSAMVLDLIDSKGFKGRYDFMYLPMDFMTDANLGYCFLNFTSHDNAQAFMDAFDGFSDWMVPSKKRCSVVWSDPHQGLEDYIERYRNSPIMHQSVPIEYKPALFKDGQRVVFPPPTKSLRAPRIRYLTKS